VADEKQAPQKPKKRILRWLFVRLALILVIGVAGFLLLDSAMGPLSTPEFCTTCHEMDAAHESWEQSPHHTNASGVQVTCVSCHLPPREDSFAHVKAKVATGLKDGWRHTFGGEYDAEAQRKHVLETLPSKRCLHCHANLTALPKPQELDIVHKSACEKSTDPAFRCVACHDSLHGPKAVHAAVKKEYPEVDNSYCNDCHLYMKTEPLVTRHFEAGVGCEHCHGISEEHMGDEEALIPPDRMFPKAKINKGCMAMVCHPKEDMEKQIGHRPFFAEADPDHKVCTDCHFKHRLEKRGRRWDKETGKLLYTDGEAPKGKAEGGDGMGM